MPKQFKSQQLKMLLAFLRDVQPGEQIEQDECHSTPGAYQLNGSSEYQVPRRPQIDRQSGEQVHQNNHYSAPGTYPPNGNGSQQFKRAGDILFGIPETPLSSIPTTHMPAIPATPLTGPQPANVNPHIQERVKYYADWLAKHARCDELNDNSKEINDYVQEATKIVKVREKEVAIFAPFRPKLSALQTFTTGQVVALCVIRLLWYGDAYSHMRIARAIFDSATPGIAQFGGVWLPLPHMLMLPFIWNDYLWSTGLAGSFVSMLCYVLSAVYIFLSARCLTKNSLASFLGTLVFILNPNILYIQATPLSETVCIVTFAAACYYFLAWIYEDHTRYLVIAAAATFLATLARYDGWPLYLAILAMTLIIGVMKKKSLVQIMANEIIFGFLGGFGIVLWLVWNKIIFGDLLYFQRGPYSAQAQDVGFMQAHLLYPYHNLWIAIYSYALDTIEIIGPGFCLLAIIATVIFILHHRLKPETIVLLVFFVPFVFYVASLYSGQASLFMPILGPYSTLGLGSKNALFNVRYGTQMVAPIAVFIAISAVYLKSWKRPGWRRLAYIVLLGVIMSQAIVTANGGIITVQDRQYGISCAPEQLINIYLAQHYAGGRILENMFTSKIYGEEAGVHFSNFIYEGSGRLWTDALENPSRMVDWIIVGVDDPKDPVFTHINIHSSIFRKQFTLVAQESGRAGLSLYHRNGLSPLPTRPVPPGMLTEHQLCNDSKK